MCATEHAEVGQESFWSRLPVFRSRAEFKLGPLTTPETAKKAQSESLGSRPACSVAREMPTGGVATVRRWTEGDRKVSGQFRLRSRIQRHPADRFRRRPRRHREGGPKVASLYARPPHDPIHINSDMR